MSESFSPKRWQAFCRFYNTLNGICDLDRERLTEAHDIDLHHQALLMYYGDLSTDHGTMNKMHDLVRQHFFYRDKTVRQQMEQFGVRYNFSENTYLKWMNNLVQANMLERQIDHEGDKRISIYRPTEFGANSVKTIQRLKAIRVQMLDGQGMFDHWFGDDYTRELIERLYEELTLPMDEVAEDLGIIAPDSPGRKAYTS